MESGAYTKALGELERASFNLATGLTIGRANMASYCREAREGNSRFHMAAPTPKPGVCLPG